MKLDKVLMLVIIILNIVVLSTFATEFHEYDYDFDTPDVANDALKNGKVLRLPDGTEYQGTNLRMSNDGKSIECIGSDCKMGDEPIPKGTKYSSQPDGSWSAESVESNNNEVSNPSSCKGGNDGVQLKCGFTQRVQSPDGTVAEHGQDVTLHPSGNWEYGYVETLTNPSYSIHQGRNVKKADDSIILGSAGRFSVSGAGMLKVGNMTFEDIGQSVFVIENDEIKYANVVSAKNNNTLKINGIQIIIDTDEQFQAIFQPDGSINITTEYEIEITTGNETVKTSEKGINKLVVDSKGFVYVNLPPSARYLHFASNEDMQAYSFYNNGNNDFMLYFDKVRFNDNCSNCGFVSKEDKQAIIKGVIEYERYSDDADTFVDVIISNSSDNEILMLFDLGMNKIKSLTYSGTLAHFYSGPFEIRYADGMYSYRFLSQDETMRPDVIAIIEPDKTITQQTLTRVINA